MSKKKTNKVIRDRFTSKPMSELKDIPKNLHLRDSKIIGGIIHQIEDED
jgi:hypothetical protein